MGTNCLHADNFQDLGSPNFLPPEDRAGMRLPLWDAGRERGVPDADQANASCRDFLPARRELGCTDRRTRAF